MYVKMMQTVTANIHMYIHKHYQVVYNKKRISVKSALKNELRKKSENENFENFQKMKCAKGHTVKDKKTVETFFISKQKTFKHHY